MRRIDPNGSRDHQQNGLTSGSSGIQEHADRPIRIEHENTCLYDAQRASGVTYRSVKQRFRSSSEIGFLRSAENSFRRCNRPRVL